MYDKRSDEFKLLPIKIVAQSRGFYSEKDESGLNKKIEKPAHAPLEQLRNRQQIDVLGKRAVATYVTSMILRGPYRRLKKIEIWLKNQEALFTDIRRDPETAAQRWNAPPETLLREIEERERNHDSSQLSVKHDLIRKEFFLPNVDEPLSAMTWRIIKTSPPDLFLTGDNPVFFDEAYGLKPPDGEFSLPLAADVALHGSWQGRRNGLEFVDARPFLVKEINRRVVFGAVRFVFCHQHASWVRTLAKNPQPWLNRVQW